MTRRQVPGRVVGVDYGTRRVGLAISDPGQRWASPLEIFERKSEVADAAYIRHLVKREEVAQFVVGLPVHMSGDESAKSLEARAFGQWLAKVAGLPVAFFDERYSTRDAEELMSAAGWSEKQRRARRDMLAAQVILQKFLDTPPDVRAHCEGTSPL